MGKLDLAPRAILDRKPATCKGCEYLAARYRPGNRLYYICILSQKSTNPRRYACPLRKENN